MKMGFSEEKKVIIAIDGPVGSGKSTAAKLLAKRAGYAYLDTGAMYRAIGWKVHTSGVPLDDEALEKLCANTSLEIELADDRQKVFVDGKEITAEIRTPAVSRMASIVSRFAPVRHHLVRLQRDIGLKWAGQYGGVVMEGRDIGTVVFPDTPFKFYLDADVRERGKRRWKELRDKGVEVDLEETVQGVMKRDENDLRRSLDPLRKADDASVIDTTYLSLDEVVEEMLKEIRKSCVTPTHSLPSRGEG